MSIYTDKGYESRQAYLEALAEDNGVELDTVIALADMLGASEDFDGLVTGLDDAFL